MKHLIPALLTLLSLSCSKPWSPPRTSGYWQRNTPIHISVGDYSNVYDDYHITVSWENKPGNRKGLYISAHDYPRRDLFFFIYTGSDTIGAGTYNIEQFTFDLTSDYNATGNTISLTVDSIAGNYLYGKISGTAADYRGNSYPVSGTIYRLFIEDRY